MEMPEQFAASEIRRLVIEAFHHVAGGAAHEPAETILLRDGNYVGRRFEVPAAQAVWLIDDDRLIVYDSRGREAQRISTAQHDTIFRRAA